MSLGLAALRGFAAVRSDPRAPIELAAQAGFRSITLDGAAPQLRPRELDRSARRDLASLCRRLELTISGLDLWIPAGHFIDPKTLDRAANATLEAIDLLGDLTDLNRATLSDSSPNVVSLIMPDSIDSSTLDAILSKADARSIRIADHTCPPRQPKPDDGTPIASDHPMPPNRLVLMDHPVLGVGLDPAACLLAGLSPAKLAARMGDRLAMARLSDASDVSRVEPGQSGSHEPGKLNDLAYAVGLHTAGYHRPVTLDLRGVPQPERICQRVRTWWDHS